ncbi:NGN domain [Arabidopsis thaliana x Arabidopsis arenosa]|uniref:NGN domain n=1 Tax=Arabidopsis thaliana x Arabidopsis arenosa TaxID=1240361 RepID=A0A8T1YSL1_9BRAS|nr:NGN domain [Arabidopsis thaliana x Arabidopsis arenosa]
MDRKGKGKQVDGDESSSGGKKRKNNVEFRDEGLRIKKRKNPGVLQFFEESAEVGYYGGSSDEDDDGLGFLNDMEDEPEVEESVKPGEGEKGKSSFVFPKEEDINEEEFDRMMEERYKPGSGFLRYADDDVKDAIEMDALAPTSKDPPIWKVKCAIGRERRSAFCLMHKFVELKKIGTKLQIISVFSLDHVKGFIFIEADKEHDVLEACKSLTGIYATRMVLLPKAETPNLLTVQRKTKKVSEGTWARVKNGKYKGDLAQIVAVSDTKSKALIKLIPRIDIQALTQKYGGGVTVQKGQSPGPRLISSSELEEFRPLIQVRRDRDTGITFEHLDSMMLKDGYLYKKVSLDSISSWGVVPSKEEILKFTPVDRKETGDVEWISEIYGEERKKKILPTGRGGGKGDGSGGGKGEGSSEFKSESSYELYNLVCFSRKDFGLIVGVDDKGDGYKVLKEGLDGPVVVTVGKKEMQNGPFDSKFTALDLNNKQISVNDVVKISKGPSEGKQGVVRQVYRGIIFIYDESEEENGGYFCCKSHSCEKVKLFTEDSNEKTGGFDASAFGDSVSSPKSPLSPEKEWQPRERYNNSNQGDRGSTYSIGQKLRIRVGPLKGYLCRVIALRYSDVTVKLDSQHKVFTVKSEHLVEVRDRNTALSTSGDAGMGSFQPFDMLGTESSTGDWAKGAGTSGEGGNWNIGGPSTDSNPWGSKPTSDVWSQQPTVTDDNTSTWANAAAENKPASASDQPGGWDSWAKTPASEAGTVSGWGNTSASNVEASSWGKQGASTSNVADSGSWGMHGGSSGGNKQDEDSVWGKLCEASESSQKKEESSWGKKGGSESGLGTGDGESSWANKDGNSSASNEDGVSWGQQDKGSDGSKGGSAWGNQGGGFGSGEKKDGSSGWNKSAEDSNANSKGVPGWGKPDGGSSWGKQDKQDGAASWGKKDDGGSWGNKDDGVSSWGKKDDGQKDDGGSSWGKKDDGGSSWGKKDDGGSSWGKKDDGGSSWGKKDDGGSLWGKKDDGGSSWGKKDDGGSSWGKKDDGGSSWGKKDDGGYSEQTFDRGGRGFGGRRGGGRRGGRDQFGRGSSFSNSEDPAPWNKPSGGSSWGKQDSDGGGSSWGKENDAGGGSGWGKQDSGGGGSSWGKQNDASGGGSSWGKQNNAGGGSSWGKQDSGGDGSSWGKQDGGGSSGSGWGKQNNTSGGSSWGKQGDAGGGSSWGKQDGGGGGSSWGKQDGGGGSGSAWGKQNDTSGGSSSWGKQSDSGGGSSWGKQDGGGGGSSWGKPDVEGGSGSAWGKQNDGGGGGSSWGKQGDGGSKPWNEQSGGGSRGGGGFRGGFRGGRNQSGRGGRSFDGDQSSSWKTDNQENTWKSNQSGGSDWKKGWGEDSNNSKPSGSSSGGGAGNWPSWDTNSKRETNDKLGDESKSAWGTSNDQANTDNNNDTWNKKPNNDVGMSGEADNAWGGNTNAPSPSGSAAWGTGDKKTGW